MHNGVIINNLWETAIILLAFLADRHASIKKAWKITHLLYIKFWPHKIAHMYYFTYFKWACLDSVSAELISFLKAVNGTPEHILQIGDITKWLFYYFLSTHSWFDLQASYPLLLHYLIIQQILHESDLEQLSQPCYLLGFYLQALQEDPSTSLTLFP